MQAMQPCVVRAAISHYRVEMLAKTRKHMSDEDAGAVRAGLEAFAKAILDKRRR